MLKNLRWLLVLCLLASSTLQAQVIISDDSTATADPSAALDIQINGVSKKGFLLPRVTQAQRVAIASPAEGLLLIQTDGTAGIYLYLGGRWKLVDGFSNAPPSIASYSPTSGVKDDVITIIGTEFDPGPGNNTVTISGVTATVLTATTTQLTVRVPYTINGNVVISIGGNPTTAGTPFDYLEPTITSITPTTARAGATIQVDGQYFDAIAATNQVRFNGTTTTTSSVNGARTQLQVIVPLNGTDGNLTSQVQLNTSNGVAFTYLKPVVTAISGSGRLNSTITITGTNFSDTPANNIVTFPGSVTGTVTASSATSLTVTVPNTTDGNLTVRVGQYTSPGFVFDYELPTITDISYPSLGAGAELTINGTFFDPNPGNNDVRINGSIATIKSESVIQIVVYVPSFQTGTVTVRRIPDNKTATGPTFTYDDVTVDTYAGTGTAGYTAGTTTRLLAQLNLPYGIVIDGNDDILVSDLGNNRIRKVKTAFDEAITIAGTGGGGNTNNSNPLLATFSSPFDIGLDALGNVYILSNQNIRRLDGATGAVTTLGTLPAVTASTPIGIWVDPTGDVYVGQDFRIYRVSNAGVTTVFAGTGTSGSANNTNPLLAEFSSVTDIVGDASGNIFANEGGRIRKISTSGEVTTLAVGVGVGYIAIDPSGNLYLSDFSGNRIRKVSPTGVVSILAGDGLTTNDNGAGATASFNRPIGIAVSSTGIIYVSVDNNGPTGTQSVIRRITP